MFEYLIKCALELWLQAQRALLVVRRIDTIQEAAVVLVIFFLAYITVITVKATVTADAYYGRD